MDFNVIHNFYNDEELFEYMGINNVTVNRNFWLTFMPQIDVNRINDTMRYFYYYMASFHALDEFIIKFYSPDFTEEDLRHAFQMFLEYSKENTHACLLSFAKVLKDNSEIDFKEILIRISEMKKIRDVDTILSTMFHPEMSRDAVKVLKELWPEESDSFISYPEKKKKNDSSQDDF